MRIVKFMLAAALATLPAGLLAAEAPCPATPAALPGKLVAWSHAAPLAAGAPLALGRAAVVRLSPVASVAYKLPPEKPGKPGSFGGVLSFAVPAAGTYRVALGTGAWVDVVRDGKPVASATHGHGPACSGIRKIVGFALTPGSYDLQVAGSDAAAITLMVVGAD